MKLSQLTMEQKTRLLAELDGLAPVCRKDTGLWHWENPTTRMTRNYAQGISEEHLVAVTNYLTSYDAIIPLIQKLGDEVKSKMWTYLTDTSSKICIWIDATPSQLCDAVLVATGKAKL